MTYPERQATTDAVTEQLERDDRALPNPPPTASWSRTRPGKPSDREQREIKDSVLRTGTMVEEAIRAVIKALVDHDADGGPGWSSRATAGSTRHSVHASSLNRADHRDEGPVARDLRFLPSLDHVTYELERIGDHAASVAKQARKLAPHPPLPAEPRPAGPWANTRASLVHESCGPSSTSTRSRPARSPSRDDEIDDLNHKTFADVVELMRADPDNVERGTTHPLRRALHRAHRGSCDEHRRGRGLPRERRGRGPEPVMHVGQAPDPGPVRVHGELVPAASWPRRSCAEIGGDAFEVHSAGTHPKGLNPSGRCATLGGGRHRASWARPKSVDEFRGQAFDYVITVCDQAREVCPYFPGGGESLHWGYEDPADATGHGRGADGGDRRVLPGPARAAPRVRSARARGRGGVPRGSTPHAAGLTATLSRS